MRVILLGASNVTLAFPRLWHGLRRACADPVELFAAHGHGRSFGMWSRIGPRELPGIVQCRLWEDLAVQPPSVEPPRALITDIGNDLLYGVDPDRIVEWIATCIERLNEVSARIVLTQLPIASAVSLGPARFRFFRSLFFPTTTVQFGDLLPKVARLNQNLIELGRKHHIPTLELRGQWYGFDPIHIRRRSRDPAWQELLASWFDDPKRAQFHAASPTASLRQWRQRPSERRWFGREQLTIQPSLREMDGSTLWLY